MRFATCTELGTAVGRQPDGFRDTSGWLPTILSPILKHGTAVVAIPVEIALEFHRRVAAIVEAVQRGIWRDDVRDVLGHATDYSHGEGDVVQTLVLKSRHRSAYVRLRWSTIMGDSDADREGVSRAIESAIRELA